MDFNCLELSGRLPFGLLFQLKLICNDSRDARFGV